MAWRSASRVARRWSVESVAALLRRLRCAARRGRVVRAARRPRPCGASPGFAALRLRGAARSVLKMERVDPGPGAGFRDARGLSMATASRAGRTSAHRSGLLPSTDQVSRFRGAIHLQGSTPDRSVQGGDRFTSERHVTAPMRGKHDHMPYRPRRDGRRTNGWREQVQQHQVLAPGRQGLRRASGAPGDERQQAAELNSTNGSHGHRL